MKNLLAELSKPFHPSEISFKPGATKGDRAIALAYADLRVYMNRLDEVCGLDWSIEYKPWGDERIIACLTINGVTRCSTGEMKDQDEKNEIGGTVAEAQSMKRACTMFGLGRYLYDLPTGWAEYDPAKRQFTDAAKAKLTAILNQHYRKATEGAQKPATLPTSNANPFDDVEFEKPRATAAQLETIGKLGVQAYGAEYNSTRLAQWKSKGSVSSLDQLLETEAVALITALNRKISDDAVEAAQPQAEAIPA